MIESKEHNFSIFDRYRNGDLSDSELKEFYARLSYDSEFKASFDEFEAIEDGIKTHFRNQFKTKLQEVDENMDSKSRRLSGKLRFLTWGASIAAALVIGFFVFQQFNTPTHLNIVQHYWPYEEGLPVKMSSASRYDEAMNAFKLEEWDLAENLLTVIGSDTAAYFLGEIAYRKGELPIAVTHYSRIDRASQYFNKAQFKLALIHVALGDMKKAKEMFNSLIEEDTDFADEAKEILNRI